MIRKGSTSGKEEFLVGAQDGAQLFLERLHDPRRKLLHLPLCQRRLRALKHNLDHQRKFSRRNLPAAKQIRRIHFFQLRYRERANRLFHLRERHSIRHNQRKIPFHRRIPRKRLESEPGARPVHGFEQGLEPQFGDERLLPQFKFIGHPPRELTCMADRFRRSFAVRERNFRCPRSPKPARRARLPSPPAREFANTIQIAFQIPKRIFPRRFVNCFLARQPRRAKRQHQSLLRLAVANGEPKETLVLTLGATGLAREKTIYEAAREYSFEDLKGDLDRIGELAGGWRWQAGAPSWLAGARAAKVSLAHGKGSAESIGHAGQLARRVADEFKLRQEAFVAELGLEPLLEAVDRASAGLRFKPLPRYPAVERDFSLIVADGVTFAQVEETIRALAIPELEEVDAADLFRGGQIPPGKFSLMIQVVFQSAQTTLTEGQVQEFSARIVKALEEKLGAVLRTN